MNHNSSVAQLILIFALLLFGCAEAVKEEHQYRAVASDTSLHVGDEKYVAIDTQETVVTWKGSSIEGSHTGYVSISKGELMIENGALVGGTVEVNMQTIVDESHRNDNNLIEHLKDPDFFDVQKFPTATMVIDKVASITGADKTITGNLTIKGITQYVSFPATIAMKDRTVTANGKLVIDRTLWDIRYKSGKFFANLANQAISDSIEINVKLVARK
jgi:polyisoprenoid-binding protein YceI